MPLSTKQRKANLIFLADVCSDSQLIVDLFVNYDCDLQSDNLFEELVLALIRQIQSSLVSIPRTDKIIESSMVTCATFKACRLV